MQKRPSPVDRSKRIIGSVLMLVGLVLVAWPTGVTIYGEISQKQAEKEFEAEEAAVQRTEQPSSPAPVPQLPAFVLRKPSSPPTPIPVVHFAVPRPSKPRRVAPGKPMARLRIPSIDLNVVVIEGATDSILRRGPGHLPGTGLPGEQRNCAIAAHRAYWFKRVPELQKGDSVFVETPTHRYWYKVTARMTVTPNRGDLLNQGKKPLLTLITCTTPTYDSPHRVLVFCRLVRAAER